MGKGKGSIKVTKTSDKTVRIAARVSKGMTNKVGESVSASLNSAFEKGSKLNSKALLAILTTKGSKLSNKQAENIINKMMVSKTGKIANPLKGKASKIVSGYKNPAMQAMGLMEMMADSEFADFVEKLPDEKAGEPIEALAAYTKHLEDKGSPKYQQYKQEMQKALKEMPNADYRKKISKMMSGK